MPRTTQYNRDHVLQKAVNLFWRRGYHATSLKAIEEELDMRPGSLYAAFGNKQGLFNAAIDTYAQAMRAGVKAHIESRGKVIEGVIGYLRALLLDSPGQHPAACMVVKTLLESTDLDKSLHDKAVSLLQQVEDDFSELFEQAKAAGELHKNVDSRRLARLLQTQIMGARSFSHSNNHPEVIQHLLDDIEMIFEPYQAAD